MLVSSEAYVPQTGARARSALRSALLVWGGLLLLSLAIVGLVVTAPVMRGGHETFAGTIYRAFSYLCHQIPERSFHLAGHPLAVCARCTGIYSGFMLGVLAYPLARSLKRRDSPSRVWLLVAALPISADFLLGYSGLWANTHLSRLATGAFFGAVCAFFVVPGLVDIAQTLREKLSARRPGGASSRCA
ncbi:MAG TPA: DUF2085 domain-containing protein [Pyrinomonadaceae bacterium]